MSDSSFLEIVETENGEFSLKRLGSDEEPLVKIQFSGEIQDFIGEDLSDIVKAMIGAGVQKASTLSKDAHEAEQEAEEFKELDTVH